MEEQKTSTETNEDKKDVTEHITDFLETYYKLITINVAQKGINLATSIINSAVLVFLCLLVFLFIGFGLAWLLGNAINSRAGGFFIVAGIYLLIMIILISMRKKVIFPFLRDLLTRKIYE